MFKNYTRYLAKTETLFSELLIIFNIILVACLTVIIPLVLLSVWIPSLIVIGLITIVNTVGVLVANTGAKDE